MTDDPGGSHSPTPRSATRTSGAEEPAGISRAWRGLAGRLWGRNGENSVRETIEELIEDQGDSAVEFDRQERTLLANILKLRDQTVADVMVPRADIVAIDADSALDDLVKVIKSAGHSRVPVYQETLDDAIGMVHFKDLIDRTDTENGFKIRDVMRDVLFVAPSMQVLELLLEMRVKRTHMALVVDEFGGVDGLLTIEDLVEEIVGEIEDEHDREVEPEVSIQADGAIDADARVLIEDFERRFGSIASSEEREEIDTLGGLVFSLAGRVPIRGELVRHPSGAEIEVLEADPRRIRRLRVRGVAAPNDSTAEAQD